AAAREMSMLPDEHKAPADVMLHPNLAPVRDHVAAAIAQTKADQAAVADRVKLGKDDLRRFNDRLNNLSYEIPNFQYVDIRPNSRLEGVIFDIYRMFKDVNLVFDKSSFLIGQSDGIIRDDLGVLSQMDAPLHAKTIGGDTLRLLPSYADVD